MGRIHPKLTLNSLEKLLKNRFKEGFLSLKDLPHPSIFKDMNKATDRIIKAINNKEQIVIIGDYDVDGIISTTLMKLFFNEIEYPIKWIIPNRFRDGYGLSENIISRIKESDLAITVDNGISAVSAAQLCKEQNIELIITDHHLLAPQIPEAYVIINQKQEDCNFPYKDICGAQIAWYLIASLKNALEIKIDIMSLLELVSIAIIADMMPLKDINRAMVITGLKSLSNSKRPAIKAFLEKYEKEKLSSEDISFLLAPLLNSPGRMDDALYAVDFLSSSNIYDARVKLDRLIDFNNLRKETEAKITKEALDTANVSDNILVLVGKEWHEGVVGIVAARVARIHKKPTIILSLNKEGMLKGSGRSFDECDLFAITNSCREYLEKFGGHQAAIGLSLKEKNLEKFKAELQKNYSLEEYKKETLDSDIVGELNFNSISFDILKIIDKYEPYGFGNSRPKFISKNVRIIDVTTMGKENNHLRFSLEQNAIVFNGVKFKTYKKYTLDSQITITYTLNKNYFNGRVRLQLLIDNISIINTE